MTRNPRVDFISNRVEEIKTKKANISALAHSARLQLSAAHKTLVELDTAMIAAFNDELGQRQWDDTQSTYTRLMNAEERRLVSDMERVFTRCRDTMQKVVFAYLDHLQQTEDKPLTYNTPDEEARLATVMQTKEQYKSVRTIYSDAMIDQDAELSTGASASHATQRRVEEAKKAYDEASECLCDDALRYERIFRDELAQRVSAHFLAEQHLLRGVSSAMRDFMPYTKGLTLDWQQMRETRRTNLAAEKASRYVDDDDDITDGMHELPLPGVPSETRSSLSSRKHDNHDDTDSIDGATTSTNPFGNIAADMQRKGSNAAAALSSAGKSATKSISDMVSSIGTKAATKTATKSVKSSFS